MATEYVMVPVPEEVLDEVMQFLRWQTAPPAEVPFDEEAVAQAVREADDVTTRIVLAACNASRGLPEFTVAELARAVPCGERELLGTVLELNQRLLAAGGLQATITLKPTTPGGPLGEQLVSLPAPVAEALEARVFGGQAPEGPDPSSDVG